MAKKRKKLTQRILENRKVKWALGGLFAFFALASLGAALNEKVFRASVGIEGFESVYSEVPSKTRKALKSEMDDFIFLNTGDKTQNAKFAVREGQEFAINENEDSGKYSSFLMDSDELQISARVQMVWGHGYSEPDASFVVRVDCAKSEEIKYENNYCYARSTGDAARAIALDNLGLLESYGAPSEAIREMQDEMLSYLKIAYPEAKSALIERASINKNGTELRAKLKLDGRIFELTIETSDDWSIKLQSGENVIWESDASRKNSGYRHYSVLKKLLPVELESESGAHFSLEYGKSNQLVISSVKCVEKTENTELEQAAKEWLSVNNFDAEAFKIKLKKACEN